MAKALLGGQPIGGDAVAKSLINQLYSMNKQGPERKSDFMFPTKAEIE